MHPTSRHILAAGCLFAASAVSAEANSTPSNGPASRQRVPGGAGGGRVGVATTAGPAEAAEAADDAGAAEALASPGEGEDAAEKKAKKTRRS